MKGHADGDNTGTRGRAHGGGTVRVGKVDAFLSQSALIRSWAFRFGIIATHVAAPEVIGKNKNAVALFSGGKITLQTMHNKDSESCG